MPDLEEILKLCRAGQDEKARDQLVALACQFPSNPDILFETACVHDRLGMESDAISFYLTAISHGLTGKSLREAYLGLGSSYRVLGQYEKSKKVFEEGLARFPDAPELDLFLAMTLYNLGRHHDAMSLLLRLIADTTSDAHIRNYERAIRFYAKHLDTKQH